MLYKSENIMIFAMLKRYQELVPPYFLVRSLILTSTGIIVMACVYAELVKAIDTSSFILSLALLYPVLFISSYLYLTIFYPLRESNHYPNSAQHPILLLLSILNYGCAIALIEASKNAVDNLHVLTFLLALPAASTAGLRGWQAVLIISIANLTAGQVLLAQLDTSYFLQIASSQVLVYLLFNTMISEFKQKTIASINLAQLTATQNLLESRVAQETREAIARDLHDELGHLSTVISHNLNQYCYTHQNKDPLLINAMELTRKMSEQIRTLSHTWQEPVFDIKSALETLAHSIPRPHIVVDTEGFDGSCSASSGAILFRCCQEIITNSIRHSNASTLYILIMKSPTQYSISIEDNGSGKTQFKPGKGLNGIYSRVKQLGGKIDLALNTDGFRATLVIPAL